AAVNSTIWIGEGCDLHAESIFEAAFRFDQLAAQFFVGDIGQKRMREGVRSEFNPIFLHFANLRPGEEIAGPQAAGLIEAVGIADAICNQKYNRGEMTFGSKRE